MAVLVVTCLAILQIDSQIVDDLTDSLSRSIIFLLTKLDLMHTLYYIKNFRFEAKNMVFTYEEQANIFKALCDEKRLRILEKLRDGEECVCVLVEQLDMAQSSLSYHMKILCDSGIVVDRQEGKWTYYKISEKGCSFALELLRTLTTPTTVT